MDKGFIYHSPIGALCLIVTEDDSALKAIHFSGTIPVETICEETLLVRRVCKQLDEYFAGARITFDLPFYMVGTLFQRKVWNALCRIPYGETRSYKQIAIEIESPLACRAVGLANNRNPLPIVIPCHRVVGVGGKLVGYAGGLSIKEKLLDLEGVLNKL